MRNDQCNPPHLAFHARCSMGSEVPDEASSPCCGRAGTHALPVFRAGCADQSHSGPCIKATVNSNIEHTCHSSQL